MFNLQSIASLIQDLSAQNWRLNYEMFRKKPNLNQKPQMWDDKRFAAFTL